MATYTSTQDGNWNTDATWGGGGHPTSNDDVAVIGHDVTYDAGESSIVWGNVTINSGGMLCFPTTQSSKIVFNATAILTVNSGGEIRTGTTSTVGAVGAAYTLRFEFPQGAAERYVLVLNDGAIVNLRGADVTQYAYLDSDWTSGQSFYVEGDYSSLWSAGQTFYIHVNAAYAANGYRTQGKTYTIASVGAYDSGNDRTQITISESAPGITFSALYEGHKSKLIMVTRNIVLCDPGASLAAYGYDSYTERIQCANSQGVSSQKIQFNRCLFYGWNRAFSGGYNIIADNCCFINNYRALYLGGTYVIGGDFISNSYATNYGNYYITGVMAGNYTCFDLGSMTTFTGEIIGCQYGCSGVSGYKVRGDVSSCGYAMYNCQYVSMIGNIIGCSFGFNNVNSGYFSGGFRDTTTNVSVSSTTIRFVVAEDSTISGVDRFPYRMYGNAGNILPLDSGDTDWQTPDSANAWILQAIPNSYCNYSSAINQIQYSPVNDMATYVTAASTTLTFKIWPVGWTTSLDQDDVVLEVKYLDTASGITRTTAYNTSQTYANGAWRECSVTFTPSQAGVVYFQLYFRSYESGCYVLIDPIWSVA